MFTAEELAAHADTTVQRIEWMTELGILTPSDEGYRRSDIQLVRVADAVDHAGIALDDIGTLIADGTYSFGRGDLTGSTELTERLGDEGAARMADRLAETLRETAVRHDGRVVKLLGDGAMLHFHGPAGAARAGLELVDAVPDAGLPPLRMGVHVGPVIFRDGDYYGRTVIVAARVTDRIGPSQVVLTADGVAEVTSEDLSFEDMGPADLKGVAEPIRLFRTDVAD